MHLSKFWPYILRLFGAAVTAVMALCFIALQAGWWPLPLLWGLIPAFLVINIFPLCLYTLGARRRAHPASKRTMRKLCLCAHGLEMLHIFLLSTVIAVAAHLIHLPMLWQGAWKEWLISAGVAILVEAFVFWNGMLCIYLHSTQLGVKWRLIGALCGLIPVVQLFVLRRMMRVVRAEIDLEFERMKRNRDRYEQKVCATRYPVLLVHGVFFRDFKRLNYWGRIPAELEANGATVYYGNQPSAAAVKDSARLLAERIRTIVAETGCEKVNIIAHSKGGLDIRAALAFEGIAPYVASVTTVNTPHRGCKFADILLSTAPADFREKVTTTYNAAAKLLGDENPDFLAAVSDLTADRCAALNEETAGDAAHTEGILCRSVHSRLDRATSGQFPLNCTYLLAKWFDGPNDGLVSDESAAWGESHRMLTAAGKRGISHGDMIDLNRENIPGFDVREFYVEWVADLKNRGL